ncbi:MAG: hypothetical protein HY231_11045 [Acidobacteria bacterium]|nr:hypothetical protein [Acidobacteriota bacterium]
MFDNQRVVPADSNSVRSSAFSSSPLFNEAVNVSRFVKGFGLTALAYSLVSAIGLNLLGGAIGIGIGLFVLRYDETRFYRILGGVIIVFAIVGVGAVFPFLGSGALSGTIMVRGIQVLGLLAKEGREDEEWKPTRQRTMIGTIASGAGLAISIALMLLFVVKLLVLIMAQQKLQR